MKELKVIIVDDEVSASNNLKILLETYCVGIKIIGIASEIPQAFQLITDLKPNLVFLDIELKRGNGFELLQSFSHIDFEVIFTTAYQEYAIKAIKQSALDYLLKPIDIEELREAVNKAKEIFSEIVYENKLPSRNEKPNLNKGRIVLPSHSGLTIIPVQELMYCKASGNYLHFFCFNGKEYFFSRNMKEYEELLKPFGFFRIHHSYLVNLKAVKEYIKESGGIVILVNGDRIPVSVRRKAAFLKSLSVLNLLNGPK